MMNELLTTSPPASGALHWTLFNDVKASKKVERTGDWNALIADINSAPKAETKKGLRMLKMALFGEKRTKLNSLRSDDNIKCFNGVEGDYDGEVMSLQEARDRVEASGIKAALYTSPSHTPEAPRWRVIAPFYEQQTAEVRTRALDRLNGVLGGVLATESWTLSQAYFIGELEDGSPCELVSVNQDMGGFVDQMGHLDDTAIGKGESRGDAPQSEYSYSGHGFTFPDVSGGKLQEGDGCREWLKSYGGHLRYQGLDPDEIYSSFEAFAADYFDNDNIDWDDVRGIADWFGTKATRDTVIASYFGVEGHSDTDRPKVHPLAIYLDQPPEVMPDDGFVINGVISDKLSFLGAYAGAGKTTAIAPLMLIVAGLIAVNGLEIDGWRHVVFVSEHPEQIQATLKALCEHYHLPANEVFDRIKIVEAQRMTAGEVVRVSPDYQKLVMRHTQNGVTVDFMPWVIFDTQSATFSLDNENDNAEAAAMVAAVKQRMPMPVTVVAHTAKAAKHGDATTMSVRGGGAFEGDSNQIIYLSIDPKTEQRFFEIGIPKHRFSTDINALAITYHTTQMARTDPYGQLRVKSVGYCTVEPMTKEVRKQAAEEAEHEAEREAIVKCRYAIRDFLLEAERLRVHIKSLEGLDRDEICSAFPTTGYMREQKELGTQARVKVALAEMRKDGMLVEVSPTGGLTLPGNRKFIVYKSPKFKSE